MTVTIFVVTVLTTLSIGIAAARKAAKRGDWLQQIESERSRNPKHFK